jgi:hypothetical protein
LGESYIRIPRFVVIAFVWAIVETSILVGAGVLGFVSSEVKWPLFNALWIIFGVATFVGYSLGEPEDTAKALFLSQIVAIPLSFMLLLGVAPPVVPSGYYGDLTHFEGGLFVVLGIWLFITSMAGSFSGWILNSFIGTNRDYSLDWKRVLAGLGLAVSSIYLPVSPLIVTGWPLTALAVAGVALLSVIVVRSGLNKRITIASREVGFLVVAGMLVFLLSSFSLWYVNALIPVLFWTQCLTLIAPSLILLRLLVGSFDLPSTDYSVGLDRQKIE